MSADAETPASGSRANRRVQDALDEMHARRAEFRRALQVHQVDQGLHLRFQQAVLDVYDELRPYRDEVEDEWGDATPYEEGLDALVSLAGRTTETSSVQVSNGVLRRQVSRDPYRIPAGELVQTSYDLDEIACELGFGPEIDGSETRTEIGEDLIEEVEAWRRETLE